MYTSTERERERESSKERVRERKKGPLQYRAYKTEKIFNLEGKMLRKSQIQIFLWSRAQNSLSLRKSISHVALALPFSGTKMNSRVLSFRLALSHLHVWAMNAPQKASNKKKSYPQSVNLHFGFLLNQTQKQAGKI